MNLKSLPVHGNGVSPHYQSKFGELPLDESLAMLQIDTPNVEQLAMLTAGMENLVGVLGMVKGGQLDDPESIH